MKNITIKKFATVALITSVILGTGCAKIDDFGTTNQDPNGITTPVTAALLTNVQSGIGGFAAVLRTAVYSQYVAENQYTDVSLNSLPLLEMGGTYSGNLQDLQTIISYNSDPKTAAIAAANGSNANQIAFARILKAYIYWQTTDRWGDIPYSQALQGAAFLTPKFDKQEDIYFDLIKECKEAVAMMDNGATVKGDLLYPTPATQVANWKKLGNSLRMLMAMRLTKRYPAAGDKAAIEFASAVSGSGGIIDDNSASMTLEYPGGTFRNVWYNVYETRDDYASSKTLGDVLQGLGDTRSSAFGTGSIMFPTGLTRDLAIAYGNSVGNGQSRVLALSKRTQSSPVVIVAASTVLLARAEAKERGWIAGGTAGAMADYNAAVAASFGQWGLTMPGTYLNSGGGANYNDGTGVAGGATGIGAAPAPYDNFRVASGNVQDALTGTKLQRIALQRWIAAFPNGNEGWAELRRTGTPNLKDTRFATGATVRRYVYGNNDYGLNNANTLEAVGRLTGGDKQESRIWWNN